MDYWIYKIIIHVVAHENYSPLRATYPNVIIKCTLIISHSKLEKFSHYELKKADSISIH